ncbi:MAG: LUD domain-containing protein, partial [Chromatiales bacterium]|nr:LUD domain-containing protein [Chromatiales bacterium]
MNPTCHQFNANAHAALADATLQQALGNVGRGFVVKRRAALDALPEFEVLRESARAIKDHTLAHLDQYLVQFEMRVNEAGGEVHWARNAREACDIVIGLCREAGARRVTKGKSMVSEEIGLNEA